jgi:hypothetical protein
VQLNEKLDKKDKHLHDSLEMRNKELNDQLQKKDMKFLEIFSSITSRLESFEKFVALRKADEDKESGETKYFDHVAENSDFVAESSLENFNNSNKEPAAPTMTRVVNRKRRRRPRTELKSKVLKNINSTLLNNFHYIKMLCRRKTLREMTFLMASLKNLREIF